MSRQTPPTIPKDKDDFLEHPELPRGVYDQETGDQDKPFARPELPDGANKGRDGEKSLSRDDIGEQESAADSGYKGSIDELEKKLYGKSDKEPNKPTKFLTDSFKYGDEGNKPKGLKGRVFNFARKRAAIFLVTGLVGGGGIWGLSIIQGPFQVIHLGQVLAEHFDPNVEFNNDRTSRLLLMALAGREAGRMGVTGNYAATKWEQRLIKETGMRPVYSDPDRRFVGFEIMDDNKAQDFLGDAGEQNDRNSRKVERSMGRGAEIREIRSNESLFNGNSEISRNSRIVDLSNVSFADRRAWVKTIGKATNVNGVASSIGSRLLIKRGGVNFHPMNKLKQTIDDRRTLSTEERKEKKEQRKKDKEEKRRQQIENGVQSTDGPNAASVDDSDNDGSPDSPSAGDEDVSRQSKEFIQEFKNSGVVKTGASAAAIVGVLCAAKSYGDNLPDFKFSNTVLTKMRLGMDGVTRGNQTMALFSNTLLGDTDLEELEDFRDTLQDKVDGTSWPNAETIRARQGKSGGTKEPKEAELSSATEKPELFRILDSIQPLVATCDTVNVIAGLPVLKQISSVTGAITGAITNTALKPLGTSQEELIESSMKAIAGKGVDALAKGGEYGALADSGTFLAANDDAASSGGRDLDPTEVAELKELNEYYKDQDRSTQSVAQKYINPLNKDSFAAALLINMPSSFNETSHKIASVTNASIGGMFLSSFANLIPKADAAITVNYGVPPKGFSASEQKDVFYENPYENGLREDNTGKTLEADLPRLNEEYGKVCFGMTVTVDDDGVHIQTEGQDNLAAVFEASQKNPKCKADKNTQDRFNQYRMYLADAKNVISMACYEGNKTACEEIGQSAEADTSGENDTSSVEGLECPSTLDSIEVGGSTYYKMPDAEGGLYTFDPGAQPQQRYGKKNLVCVIYTVAKAYKAKYGDQSTVKVGDLNASGHASHRWGVAVDLNAKGSVAAADSLDGAYNKEATVELGKMFVDTGKIKNIWWCPPDDSSRIIEDYAKKAGKPITIQCVSGHADHFHIDISDKRGADHTP